MYQGVGARVFFISLLFLGIAATLAISPELTIAIVQPAGTVRQASQEEAAKLNAITGNTAFQEGTWLRQEEIDKLPAAGAIKYLEGKVCSRYQVGYDASIPPAQLKETHVYFVAPRAGMDPKFLNCLQRFMEAARGTLNICISSALRTAAHQQASADDPANKVVCGRSGPVTGCPHVRGIAIDINELGGRYAEAHQLARSMGLRVPLPVADKWHIESGGACGTPDFSNPVSLPPSLPPGQTPSSSTEYCTLPDGLRVPCSAIKNSPPPAGSPPSGGASPSAPPPLSTQNSTPYQPGTCAPQFHCSNNDLYYRASTCVDQLNQVCPKGCSGVSCIGSAGSSDPLSSLLAMLSTSTKPATTTGAATSTKSAFDQISAFAEPLVVTIATNVPAPVDLSGLNGQVVMTLNGNPQTGMPSGPFSNSYQLAPPTPQQTFVSSDLSGRPAASQYSPLQISAFQSLLANLKDILLRALDYLRPFARQTQTEDEGHED